MSPIQRKDFELMYSDCDTKETEVDTLVVSKSYVDICSVKGIANIIIFTLYLKLKTTFLALS